MPQDSRSQIIDQLIKTSPQGNYGIPQDAQMYSGTWGSNSPYGNLFNKLRSFIQSSDTGRKASDVLDVITKFAGGPQEMLGNIGSSGASLATTPFLENMVKEGIINKAANLFGEDRALFMDRMGDVYDLGHIYGPKSMVHEEALSRAGKMPLAYSEGKPIGLDLPKALENENLMRIRKGGRITNLEMTQSPSNAQFEQLQALAEQSPKMEWGAQMHNMKFPRDYMNPTFLDNPNAYAGVHSGNFDNLINSVYKFFGK